ncbi:MAG TPA: multiheme c-type cytochrome [Fimbriiglobus sp.]|nr:multiheme c-type cytochrome [Fimbriiglobus sp.]
MTLFPRPRLSAAAAAAAVGLVVSAVAAPTPPPHVERSGGAEYRGAWIMPAAAVGAFSCAAASCHGGDGRKGAAGSEHSTWADYDPHRHAYEVLFQERSRRMVALLAADGRPVPAHKNAHCLACHGSAPPNASGPIPPGSTLHRTGGGCENCHGAAEKWLTVHYRRDWKALDPHRKATEYGLLPTKDLAYRTQVCGGCHVGEPGREVDHRLIAAGHPALRFEFASYQTEPVYTRHWREKGYGPAVEAWMWAIGQVGTARSAAKLLAHRAGTGGRDWPELAEYACFSCHQQLPTNPRPTRRGAPPTASLPWGSWHFPLTLELAGPEAATWTAPPTPAGDLHKLAALFRESERPAPGATKAAATAAVADLDRWLAALQSAAERRSTAPLRPDELRAALVHVLRFTGDVPETGAPSTDWGRYVQGFLAVAALYRALCAVDASARSADVEEFLRKAAGRLRFPPGAGGPVRLGADEENEFRYGWKRLKAQFEPGGWPR